MIAPRIVLLVAVLLTVLNSCQSPARRSAVAAEQVRSADTAWAQTFARKDVAGYLGFVDSMATIQQPNAPAATGTAAIRALIEGFFALPQLSGIWQPVSVEVSQGGDLAYSTGTYEMSFHDASGKPVSERGKYLEVWRKQSDGTWKMVVESFNSDLPPAGESH